MKKTFVMGSVIGTVAILMMGVFMAWSLRTSFAEEAPASFTGEVVEVISDESAVVVRRVLDEDAESYEDITCFVNDQTRIIKGGKTDLEHLLAGYKVHVEMGRDENDEEAAKLIEVVFGANPEVNPEVASEDDAEVAP